MEFRILGPLEVVEGGRQLRLGGHKQRALLAVLLLEASRVVSTDRLIDALWEDEPPESAQKSVHVYVSQLRKTVGRERLETRAPGYLLRVEEDEFDLARFQRLQAVGSYAEALTLWRGAPLAEFAHQRFARAEIARLEELRLGCLEERIELDLAAGRHKELIGELEVQVREQPLRQRLRAQLILALYRSGRDAEALEVYRHGRTVLVEQLGIEPRRELRDLQQAILNQDPALDLGVRNASVGESTRAIFVGRERELAELAQGLEDAIAGHGRLFLLVGEPGIGKSRLAEELTGRARARGARVLVGRCWEAGGAPAFWPWVQALRAYLRDQEPQTLREQLGVGATDLAQLLPDLRELFPDLPEPAVLESDSARFRLFEAACSLLRNAAQVRPLVLVLDDLHAADEPSLLLLRFLARELADSRLLVVGVYRDVDPAVSAPLAHAVAEVMREPSTQRISLAGLAETEVARFIALVAGEAPSEELVAAINEETEGNPLFVGEIVRLLAAEAGSPDRHRARLAIPDSVREVIARRLRHLSEECNRVLVLASVLGREFGIAELTQLTKLASDELLDRLDEAMVARVVSDLPGSSGRLRFAHVLIRDTLYEELTTARRVRLHRLVAEALEALSGEGPGARLAELAHHSIAGSEFEKGLRYAQRAGDRALGLLAHEEAARLYQTALDALDLSDPDNKGARCELLLLLGEAEIRAGRSAAAKSAFFQAAALARSLGLPRELAKAAVGYGGRIMYARAGVDQRLVPLLEEGLTALAAEDVELRARLLARLAGALRDQHSPERRDALSKEAVALARRTTNATALGYALDGRAAAIMAPDTVVECLALGDELTSIGEQLGDVERILQGHWHRLIAQVMVGEVEQANRDLDAIGHLANELRQPVQLWQAYAGRAMLALAVGRLREAEELISQAFALGERAQPEMAIPVHCLQRYTLHEFRGVLEQSKPAIDQLVTEYPARPVFRSALAHLHARLGSADEARRELQDLARNDFAVLPFDMEWLYAISLLAETSALLADTETASVLYRMLRPWAGFNAVDHPEGIRGSASRYLGLLAATTGRSADAAQHFETALEMNERMGALPWLARTQEDYARMLLAPGANRDARRAESLLDTAVSTYRELDMASHAADGLGHTRGNTRSTRSN